MREPDPDGEVGLSLIERHSLLLAQHSMLYPSHDESLTDSA